MEEEGDEVLPSCRLMFDYFLIIGSGRRIKPIYLGN